MTCGTALLMALTKATGSLSASWMTWACWPLVSSARLSSTREGGPQATKWPSPAIPHLRVCFLLRLFMSNFFLLLLFLSLLWTSSFSLFVCISLASTLDGGLVQGLALFSWICATSRSAFLMALSRARSVLC